MASVVVPDFRRQSHETRGAASAPRLALLAAALGVVLLIAGNAIPSNVTGPNDPSLDVSSNFGWFLAFDETRTWAALPPVALLIVVIGVLALATRSLPRPTVAGLLVGLGLGGYLLSAPPMAILMSALANAPDGSTELFPKPAFAWTLLTLGSLVIVAAGALLYARSEDTTKVQRQGPQGLGLLTSAGALAGAAGVCVASILPVVGPAGGLSYFDLSGAERWLALEPVATGLATASAVLSLASGRCRTAVAGALVGLGVIAAGHYAVIIILNDQAGNSPTTGSIVGAISVAVIGVAGVLGVLTGRPRPEAPELLPIAADDTSTTWAAPRGRTPTRHLAAAAHLDARFASNCVRDVLEERHRAVAPSFGLDLATVLRHCVSARGRHLALAILLGGLVLPLLLALSAFPSAPLIPVLVVFIAWVAVLLDLWVARYRIVARHLSVTHYDPGFATRFLSPGAERRVREVAAAESGNLVVYSGYSPHVGCGSSQGGWSFAVNITKGREDFGGRRSTPKTFGTDELYAYVSEQLALLDLDETAMSDRLYVDGEAIRDDRRFMTSRTSRPRTALTSDEIGEAGQTPEVARRYHSLNVSGWGGEIVLTTFLRFVRQGTSLYAEVAYYLLAPPRAEYRQADSIDPNPPMADRLRTAWVAAVRIATLPVEAARGALQLPAVWAAWGRHDRDKREIARNPRFDYGARASIRELAQATTYRRHVQSRDKEMLSKIIDREVLDGIISFLNARDIDTSELRERGEAVLNNGVIVTGGQLTAQTIAVGEKSRATNFAERARNIVAAAKNES